TDTGPINEAYASPGGLIRSQRENLIKDLIEVRSPTGRLLSKEKAEAFKSVEPLVVPRDLTGVLLDPESGLRMARLKSEVLNRMDQDVKEGKDPRLRITEGAPEYMLAPERLKQKGYIKPFLQRVQEGSQRISEAPGLPKTPEGAVGPALTRLPNESILEWKKRTGK
ncbi:MAG: hypothetical protein ACREB3_01635, partial [Burkholderiales bacterium]